MKNGIKIFSGNNKEKEGYKNDNKCIWIQPNTQLYGITQKNDPLYSCSGHLLYWGKAIAIYPICESNVYVLAQTIQTPVPTLLQQS